ncbi:hypothetical protein HK100_009786, partial [Physocladia obscura]
QMIIALKPSKAALGETYIPDLHPDSLLEISKSTKQQPNKSCTNVSELEAMGRPVNFQQHHNFDIVKILNTSSQERLLTHAIRESQKNEKYRFQACSVAAGSLIDQVVVVLDLAGFPFMQFTRAQPLLTAMTQILSDYHPESLGRIFIINASFMFSAIWKVLTEIIAAETAAKVKILGTDYKAVLFEHIDKANIPQIYGGECVCQGGCEYSDAGPWNDGTASGFAVDFWEEFALRDASAAVASEAARDSAISDLKKL